jgi:hypothetical protein
MCYLGGQESPAQLAKRVEQSHYYFDSCLRNVLEG